MNDIVVKPKLASCLVAFTEDGKILTVTRRNTDILSLPGGKADPGETILNSIIRECYEETSLHLDYNKLIPVYSAIEGEFYCQAYFYNQYLKFHEPYEIEKGITVSFRSIDDLLTKGTFVQYNTAVFKEIDKL